MIVGAIIAGIAPAVASRMQHGYTVTPDGYYYAAMGRGTNVPRPYRMRVVAKWLPPTTEAWTLVSTASLVFSVAAVYLLTVHHTNDPMKGFYASALFGALPYTRRLLVWPVLTDAMAIAGIGLVGIVALYSPILAVAICAALVVVHERSVVHAALLHWWITDTYWAALAIGVLALVVTTYRLNAKDDEFKGHPEWLQHPMRSALAHHRKVWTNASVWLLPWGACLAWLAAPTLSLAFLFIASYVPLVVSMDRVRTYMANPYPFLIASAAVTPPEFWIPLYILTFSITDGAV